MKTAAKSVLFYLAGLLFVFALLFVPAGTLDYWQAWAYIAALFVPMAFVLAYFLATNPEFLERRFQTKEREAAQRLFMKLSALVFFVGFLLPGLDKRFGWSSVPPAWSLAADVAAVIGYAVVFWVFRVNSYAARTIGVEKGQKLVSTGPYAIIRHPMYLGALLIYLATPIALGSLVAVLPFILIIPLIAHYRIGNEEEVLRRELEGYKAYCAKVKYRLVPSVW